MASEASSADDEAYYELMMQQGSLFDAAADTCANVDPVQSHPPDDDEHEAWLSAMVASSEEEVSMVKDESDTAWMSLLQRSLEERELPATDAACGSDLPRAHHCSRELEAETLLRWLDSAGDSGALRNTLAADRHSRRRTAGGAYQYWVNSWTEPSCAAATRLSAPVDCSMIIFSIDIAATANVCMAALAALLVSDVARVQVVWSGPSREMPSAQRDAVALALASFGLAPRGVQPAPPLTGRDVGDNRPAELYERDLGTSVHVQDRDLGTSAQEGRDASSAERTEAASTAALEIACGHLANAELTRLRAENTQLRRKLDMLHGVGRCVSGSAYVIPGNLVDVFGDTIDAVDHVRSFEKVSARFVGVVGAYQHAVLRWGHPVLRTRANGPYFVFVLHEANAQGSEEPTPITNERMCSAMHWPLAPSAEDIPEYTGLVAGTSLDMDRAFRVFLRAADLQALKPGDPENPVAMWLGE